MLLWHQFLNKAKKYGWGKACAYAAEALIKPWKMRFWSQLFFNSYASHEEDLIIYELLGRPPQGTYVDIGAHDPSFINNTKFFYDRGWRGWNIEPDPERIEKFDSLRPRDTNLPLAVTRIEGQLTFYRCKDRLMSTLDPVRAGEIKELGSEIIEEIPVRSLPLHQLVREFKLPAAPEFLSIDVEGLELEVLQSNDWALFQPKIICVEVSEIDILKPAEKLRNIEEFLLQQQYRQVHLTINLGEPLNAIFAFQPKD